METIIAAIHLQQDQGGYDETIIQHIAYQKKP
jgi:hypothetical protein